MMIFTLIDRITQIDHLDVTQTEFSNLLFIETKPIFY